MYVREVISHKKRKIGEGKGQRISGWRLLRLILECVEQIKLWFKIGNYGKKGTSYYSHLR